MSTGYRYDVTKAATDISELRDDCRTIVNARGDDDITLMQMVTLLVVHLAASMFLWAFRREIAP